MKTIYVARLHKEFCCTHQSPGLDVYLLLSTFMLTVNYTMDVHVIYILVITDSITVHIGAIHVLLAYMSS